MPVPNAHPGYLQSLLDPLGSMDLWASEASAKDDLTLLACNATGMRNHSLWWNYIYLHERYVKRFSPRAQDTLPGFPDMDTAVKVGAPCVYNWYYVHRQLPTTPLAELSFVDLSLSAFAGFLDKREASSLLDLLLIQDININYDARNHTAMPFWLLASAWGHTPKWSALMNALHDPMFQGRSAGVSALDRQVVSPALLWHWQCLAKKDIGFLPQAEASQALDALRLGSLEERLRVRCESHFLSYFPQCKSEAEIAFALGAPLWLPPIAILEGPLDGDVFEARHEALHPK